MARGDVERETLEIARELARLSSKRRSRLFRTSWWNEKLMEAAMARPGFKTELFRFVDVFPAMTDDDDVARHVVEYFEGDEVPWLLETGGRAGRHVPGGSGIIARTASRNIERMARQFIAGSDPADAVDNLHELWKGGSAFTVDVLGEKTVVATEADAYAAKVEKLIHVLADDSERWKSNHRLEFDDRGRLPRVNVSIKPTALATHYHPLSAEVGLAAAKDRIRPLLRIAMERGAFVHFDMEHREVKDLTLRLFRELLDEDEFARLPAGIVVQAYLRDSYDDLTGLVEWSRRRAEPITVRLVKGAYWDAETIEATAAGWPVPVYDVKADTDRNYERCTELLLDNHKRIRGAFASHNLRSVAHAIAYARDCGVPTDGIEIQMLYGMAEPIHHAVRKLGLRLRVYCPVGDLVPGMAYLVRRLLENTSNESFVRHRFAEEADLERLIRAPDAELTAPVPPHERAATNPKRPSDYQPEPVREWRRPEVLGAFAVAVESTPSGLGGSVPAFIGGAEVRTTGAITSVDPAQISQVVAESASCSAMHADAAVEAAVDAAASWAATPWRDRAAVLFGAAARLRDRRDELAALEVFEAGKPWDQADADVCEAIDFCEYYGREALRLGEGGDVQSPPGERNRMTYAPKGVTAVIAPWNFPLAIPTGMVTAALVTGNPVVLKPAEQTPAVAWELVKALRDAGAPEGTIGFLPGVGEVVGAALVAHPDVATIVFTGSKDVGLAINAAAATPVPGQRHVKRVIAEMGGKNALIIDGDADLDQAVPGAIVSAFGYAGQKCSAGSRLIVLDAVYDKVVDRLTAMGRELLVGHPSRPGVDVGPVIDADAHARIQATIDDAARWGDVVLARNDVPDGGWFIGPTIVAAVDPDSPLARDEIFGPVLAVMRARDLDHALAIANDSPYALTGGVYSRLPSTIARVGAELRAGNIYINRPTTGAVVGRQPFGGFGMSGVGSKAGGPDYLHQFVDPRVVTENTMRQGFTPF